MTDNEILKALESCNALVKMRTCKTCPLYTFEGCCTAEMLRQTVDLINRQKEQIEGLIAGQETLQKYIAEKNAEIERLQYSAKEWQNTAKYFFTERQNIKSEAVKEFAEKMKGVIPEIDDTYIERIVEDYIDNLVKEMVGEG